MMELLQFIERVGTPAAIALVIIWRIEGRLDLILAAIVALQSRVSNHEAHRAQDRAQGGRHHD